MNAKRLPAVESCIAWAFLQTYTGARQAADEYTAATDSAFTVESGGMYSDFLRFHDSPAAAGHPDHAAADLRKLILESRNWAAPSTVAADLADLGLAELQAQARKMGLI